MPEPLTAEQQELISASIDGELNAAEQAIVRELLQREEAQAYLKQLQAARALVARHGTTQAPATLAAAVKAGISARKATVHQLPATNWRTAMYAVAAAVIVALGIMFGPMLVSPQPDAPRGIAREVLDHAPPAPPTTDRYRRAEAKQATPDTEDVAGRATLDSDNAEKRRDENKDMARLAGGIRDAAKSAQPADNPPTAPAEGESAPASRGTALKPERKHDSDGDAGAAESETGEKESVNPAPPAGAKKKEEPEQAAADEIAPLHVLEIQAPEALAAQNDVLWLGGMYGKAELQPDGERTEGISIEVPTSRAPALLKALALLAEEQRYGRATPTAQVGEMGDRDKAGSRPRGIREYLPAAENLRRFNDDRSTVRVLVRIR
jgi:hypothetical protein